MEQNKRIIDEFTLQEMREIVWEANDYDFYMERERRRVWAIEQQEKAPEILALLRRHIPADRLSEVEEFLSTSYGCECLRGAL